MDGARFANAVAQLGVKPKDITWKAGVDILSLGATKNGTPVGDAVIFFNRDLAHEFEWRCKQAGQLASKMRYIAAPWVHLLRDGAWLRHAAHANQMAARLARALKKIKGVELLMPRQANGVFVELPLPVIDALHARGWHFYTFIGEGGARLMCSWDTTQEDVDDFAADLAELMANRKNLKSKPTKGQGRKPH
jgi:threonine aldolase